MKYFVCIIFVAIFLCNACGFADDTRGELKIPEPLPIEECTVVSEVVECKEPEYRIYDIPINQELQIFIQDECDKYKLSETMFYGIVNKESEFKQGLISQTHDHGISQININTFNWLNKKYFNNELNINNQKDKIKASIFYLNYVKKYWQDKDLCDEEVFKLTILSYHLGINGCSSFVKKYGYNSNYLNEVIEFKTFLETRDKE